MKNHYKELDKYFNKNKEKKELPQKIKKIKPDRYLYDELSEYLNNQNKKLDKDFEESKK